MDMNFFSSLSTDGESENESGVSKAMKSEGTLVGLSWLEQDEVLRQRWTENKTPEEISSELGRSIAAIMTRAARLGLPRRAAPGRKRGYKRTDLPRRAAPTSQRVRVVLPPAEDVDTMVQPEVKMRVCLMCLNRFQSQGSHNRICPSCKGSAEYVTGSSTPDFSFKVIS